jgi:hypothetical protein
VLGPDTGVAAAGIGAAGLAAADTVRREGNLSQDVFGNEAVASYDRPHCRNNCPGKDLGCSNKPDLHRDDRCEQERIGITIN